MAKKGKLMRVWDIHPSKLCRQHLLGEHRELHAIYSILLNKKKGYSKHPETKRWQNKLQALYLRHGQLAIEMKKRAYKHNSNLIYIKDTPFQNEFVNSIEEQVEIIKSKHCECKV